MTQSPPPTPHPVTVQTPPSGQTDAPPPAPKPWFSVNRITAFGAAAAAVFAGLALIDSQITARQARMERLAALEARFDGLERKLDDNASADDARRQRDELARTREEDRVERRLDGLEDALDRLDAKSAGNRIDFLMSENNRLKGEITKLLNRLEQLEGALRAPPPPLVPSDGVVEAPGHGGDTHMLPVPRPLRSPLRNDMRLLGTVRVTQAGCQSRTSTAVCTFRLAFHGSGQTALPLDDNAWLFVPAEGPALRVLQVLVDGRLADPGDMIELEGARPRSLRFVLELETEDRRPLKQIQLRGPRGHVVHWREVPLEDAG